MENTDISNIVNFEIVKEESQKGHLYKALYLVIRDKENNIVYRKLMTFLTTQKYEDILSLFTK